MTDIDIQLNNDELKMNCKVICDKIRKCFKEYILGNLKQILKKDF